MRRADASDWVKLPGLFFRWELDEVEDDTDEEYHSEEVGHDDRGVARFAIYHRPRMAKESES